MNRRKFAASAAGIAVIGSTAPLWGRIDKGRIRDPKHDWVQDPAAAPQSPAKQDAPKPTEAPFERDYAAPKFSPKWKRPQVNRLMAQDFVIFAHSDLKMVEKLLDREPGLLNAGMDWGAGDWETALGGASHMGRKDIVEFLLSRGARSDIFCAAMMGMLDIVQALITLEPKLIDARGPHGFFNLHRHAQIGGGDAKPVLDYLQSIKEIKLGRAPFTAKQKSETSESKQKDPG